MTTYEFGRLVNRVSADHALKHVMRWGFLMGTTGFMFEKAQADAIRRYCLGKGQATEYDEHLSTLYGTAEAGQFLPWFKYWFDPTGHEVYQWIKTAFLYLIAFESSLDGDHIPDSFKPIMFQDNTFPHILKAAKATFVLINPKIEDGNFSLLDWETHLPVLEEMKANGRIGLIGATHYAPSALAARGPGRDVRVRVPFYRFWDPPPHAY